MPSRRRPKQPPTPPPTDAERFARSIRDSEAAARKALQDDKDRKAAGERRRAEAAQAAVRLELARTAHHQAVEMVKIAKRTGRGAAEADQAWRAAKANLLELETGERPSWAPKPPEPAVEDETAETSLMSGESP